MYPNGDSSTLQAKALKLAQVRDLSLVDDPSAFLADALSRQHWHRMRGLTPPSALPAVACPQPELEA